MFKSIGLLLLIAAGLSVYGIEALLSKRGDAYVTLLYGDEFLLGGSVLRKSIRESGSTKSVIALADGWIVDIISLLENPNHVRPKRFWGVYTKLKIFYMTYCKKVVYLDADTIVVKNIDDLFKCGKFCANLKHSERLNSGVMVVEPDKKLFNDMMSKVTTLPSYTGGDQGFLNSYYSDFPNAHVFKPNLPRDSISPPMQRLSTLYNADVGLYMLANKWMVEESELRVFHYTLGPLKPWDWWTAWLVKPVDVWQDVRERLEESLPGTGGGRNPSDTITIRFLFLFPPLAFAIFYYRYYSQNLQSLFRISLCDQGRQILHKFRAAFGLTYTVIPTPSSVASPHKFYKVPDCLGGVSIVVCLLSMLLSVAISFTIIPHQVSPWTGLVLTYEWAFSVFLLLFGSFLHLAYLRGKTIGISNHDHDKGYEKQTSVMLYGITAVGCLLWLLRPHHHLFYLG